MILKNVPLESTILEDWQCTKTWHIELLRASPQLKLLSFTSPGPVTALYKVVRSGMQGISNSLKSSIRTKRAGVQLSGGESDIGRKTIHLSPLARWSHWEFPRPWWQCLVGRCRSLLGRWASCWAALRRCTPRTRDLQTRCTLWRRRAAQVPCWQKPC